MEVNDIAADPGLNKKGTFVKGYGYVPDIPRPFIPNKTSQWSEKTAEEFIFVPVPTSDDQVECMKFMYTSSFKESDKWYIPGHITEASIPRLQETAWMNDELINLCLNHLQSLFCGDQSKYTTFVFPSYFLGQFKYDGSVVKFKLENMTRRLCKDTNVMEFDHVILVHNANFHWNFVVFYPRMQVMEIVDSFGGMDAYLVEACWTWLCYYCQSNPSFYKFDPEAWTLYYNRKSYRNQTDDFNCGCFCILNVVAIHHHANPRKLDSFACFRLKYAIAKFLINNKNNKKAIFTTRLCPEWEMKYPLHGNVPPFGEEYVDATEDKSSKSSAQSPAKKSSVKEISVQTTLGSPKSLKKLGGTGLGGSGGDDDKPRKGGLLPEPPDEDSNPQKRKQKAEGKPSAEDESPEEPSAVHESLLDEDDTSKLLSQEIEIMRQQDSARSDDLPPVQEDTNTKDLSSSILSLQKIYSPVFEPPRTEADDSFNVFEGWDKKGNLDDLEFPNLDDDPLTQDLEPIQGGQDMDMDSLNSQTLASLTNPPAVTKSPKRSNDQTSREEADLAEALSKLQAKYSQRPPPKGPELQGSDPSSAPNKKDQEEAVAKLRSTFNEPPSENDLKPEAEAPSNAPRKEPKRNNRRQLPTQGKTPDMGRGSSTTEDEDSSDEDEVQREFTFEELCSLPADLCEEENIKQFIVQRRKKRDRKFVWPLPAMPKDPKAGQGGRFHTKEEQKKEIQRRKKLLSDHKEKQTRIREEINEEAELLNDSINRHVDRLYQKYVHQNRSGNTVLDKRFERGMKAEYKDKNQMTAQDRRELQRILQRKEDANRRMLEDNEESITQVSSIKFVPGIHRQTVDSFEIKRRGHRDVRQGISPKWVASWMGVIHYRMSKRLRGKFVHVPAGSSRLEEAPDSILVKGTHIRYPQGTQNLCLLKSLISALYYMGLRQESGQLYNLRWTYFTAPMDMGLKMIKADMAKHAKCIGMSTSLCVPRELAGPSKKKRIKRISLKDLMEDLHPYPTVVILEGKDGQVDHAVCIVDNIIFDSTQQYALRLNMDSFNWICGDGGCQGIYVAFRFHKGAGVPVLKRKLVMH